MTSKLQFKRVGQAMNTDDIEKLYTELTSTVNSLPDTFNELKAQLRINLQGINTLIDDRKKLLTQKQNAQDEIKKLDDEIRALESDKKIITDAGNKFNNLINQVNQKLEVPV